MIEFNHTVKDPNGIHARPAGLLVKEVARFQSEVTLQKGGKYANGKGLFSLLSLSVKSGETVTVTVSGSDEREAADAIKAYMIENL